MFEMLPSLAGIRLKLQRADQQLKALKDEMAVFLQGDVYEPAVKFYGKTRLGAPRWAVSFDIMMIVKKPCPPHWSVIIGEIVHDLRSALDHCVYQLVIHATGVAPAGNIRTQFPIFLDSTKFDASRLQMLKGVSEDAAVLIKQLQPFSTGEGEKSPLWHLSNLSNFDKHRTLHLTTGMLESFNFSFPPLISGGQVFKSVSSKGPFDNNTVIAAGRMISHSDRPMIAGTPVKVNAEITFNIAFDQGTPVVGEWIVLNTLLDAANRTRESVDRIGQAVFKLPLDLPEFTFLGS